MRIGDVELYPMQAGCVSLRWISVQFGSASEVPTFMPSTFRRLSLLTPKIGPVALDRSFEEGFLLAVDLLAEPRHLAFEMPDMPMALTRSSTERVEMPWK